MPAKKKSNYISYEIQKLEKYLKQLQNYLDKNPPDQMEDRIEVLQSTRGNPIIKVISSKETQLKCWSDRLKELPKILFELNTLRKEVDGQEKVEIRGGQEQPGFMDEADDAEDTKLNEEDDDPIVKPKGLPYPPKSNSKQFKDEEPEFDDDQFFDNEDEKEETDQIDEIDETDQYDEEDFED